VTVHWIVQSHPSRRELRERLLAGLPADTEVVETDFDPPNPWLGYKLCLKAIIDSGCSHGVLIQDDCVVPRNLPPAVNKVIQVEPNVPVCLYLGMLPPQKGLALRAAKEGKKFVELHQSSFLPVVAVLWPVGKASEFLTWAGEPNLLRRRNGQVIEERSDDAMGGRWMRTTRQRVVATIPSLVEHPDDAPSTIARRPGGRTALFWHGVEWDAASVEWFP